MTSPQLSPEQITQVSGLVAEYITDQREKASPYAVPLSPEQRASLDGFFLPQVLDTRLRVLGETRVENPTFYPLLRQMGFTNLPNFTTMAAVTFCDVVVSHQPFSDGLLFHELVHVEQYRQLNSYYRLMKKIEDDPEFDTKRAQKKCAGTLRTTSTRSAKKPRSWWTISTSR